MTEHQEWEQREGMVASSAEFLVIKWRSDHLQLRWRATGLATQKSVFPWLNHKQ
jgi:hypothetical protein